MIWDALYIVHLEKLHVQQLQVCVKYTKYRTGAVSLF